MKKMLSVLTIVGVVLFSAVTASAMNKADLVTVLVEKGGLNNKQATMAVNLMLSEINAAVARGERVMLPKFGTFVPSKKDKTKGGIFIPDTGFGTAMKVRASVKKRSTN